MTDQLRKSRFFNAVSLPSRLDSMQLSPTHGFYGCLLDANNAVIDDSKNFRSTHIPTVYPENEHIYSSDIRRLDGKVLFAGPIYHHFGHFLLESLARLWPLDCERFDTILYQHPLGQNYQFNDIQKCLFSLLDIKEKILVSNSAFQLSEVIVPQPSLAIGDYCSSHYIKLIDSILRSLGVDRNSSTGKKLFLSRGNLEQGLTIGESILQESFKESGYEIIYPENLSPTEQILTFSSASHIAGIQGSAFHNLIFCCPGTESIMFVREKYSLVDFVNLDQQRGINSHYIEGVVTIPQGFEAFHAQGPYIIDFEKLICCYDKPGLSNMSVKIASVDANALHAAYQAEWTYINARSKGESKNIVTLKELAEKQRELLYFAYLAGNGGVASPGVRECVVMQPLNPKDSKGMSNVPQSHKGMHYTEFMKILSENKNIKNYFEIGVFTGTNLTQIPCETAVAVDPEFKIGHNIAHLKKNILLFQDTSDSFFRANKLKQIFPCGFDLAFLDGLHLFENILRDFIGAERHSHKRSFVAIHDCLPLNHEMALREWLPVSERQLDYKDYWTGDVWKILPILKKYRPDLIVDAFDCFPTGLIVIYGLNSESRTLSDNYHEILMEADLLGNSADALEKFYGNQAVISVSSDPTSAKSLPIFRY